MNGIPEAAQALRLTASISKNVALETQRLELTATSHRNDYTFSFRFPSARVTENVAVAIEAQDGAGCALAVGTNAPATGSEALSGLYVPLRALREADCREQTPRLLLATPSQISTADTNQAGQPAMVLLSGWGFRPDATVRIAGKPARSVTWRSPAELLIELTPKMGLSAMLGSLELAVSNADGTSDTRSDLLARGYYSSVSFSPTAAVETGQEVSYLGDLNSDGRPDLVVLDPQKSRLGIFLNDGHGAFPALPTNYTTSGVPVALAVGDV